MAPLPHYLVPVVTAHLTFTETQFLQCTLPRRDQNIQWDELFMSKSLCRYGLQHIPVYQLDFLVAIVETASYNTITLPDITALFRLHTEWFNTVLRYTIKTHRPLPILIYMFQLYGLSCRHHSACQCCNYAAAANNIEVLEWLRDPNAGDGSYPWSIRTCGSAARYGHIDMLERLRDPRINNGVCPWRECACLEAAEAGQLEALIWLRNPEKGGGVCPWDKEDCLWAARFFNHTTVAAWIETQPDDD
jgi:hypothetical protein